MFMSYHIHMVLISFNYPRQVTEQFLYNKTMDQDTWFNDYKSIGEAGYRSDPLRWFFSVLVSVLLLHQVEELQDLCGGKLCRRDGRHCFLHTRWFSKSFCAYFLTLSGASIGDNLSQIEIYENGLKKAENFEVRISVLGKSIFVEKTLKSKEV